MKSEKVYIEYLVLKAQAGEQVAWDELLSIIQIKVKAFVAKFIGGSHGTEDCVQETLLTVFRKLRQLKEVKLFHTWMYRITYSKCMDYGRKQMPAKDAEDLRSADLATFEQELDIKAAIAGLPDEQQVIIYLFYYEGFIVAEIARVLDKPAGTIKYLLFAAREHIKQTLTTPLNQELSHEY